MAHDVFSYVAIKKITAEHPIGSGIDVTYEPGDEVPANEWGRATDNLVEVGKIMRVVRSVSDESDVVRGAAETSPSPASEQTADEVNAETANEPPPASAGGDEWPRDLGKGQYELSDGSHVYGKNKAQAAQDALGIPATSNEGGDGA